MPLTWAEFSGHTATEEDNVDDLNPVQEAVFLKALERSVPSRELTRFKDYILYEAIHDENMLKHAMAKASHPHLVVAMHGDTKVGLVRAGTSYIIPEHRGFGLGPEMMVQLYLITTPELWKKFSADDRRTRFGLSMMRKTYKLLLDRGLL